MRSTRFTIIRSLGIALVMCVGACGSSGDGDNTGKGGSGATSGTAGTTGSAGTTGAAGTVGSAGSIGSAGTTGLAAEQLGRDWLGIELNPDFAEQAGQRITSARTAA